MEFTITLMGLSIRVSGKITINTGKVFMSLPMEQYIKVIGKINLCMVVVFLLVILEKNGKESLEMGNIKANINNNLLKKKL
jgi:hypothetical protein